MRGCNEILWHKLKGIEEHIEDFLFSFPLTASLNSTLALHLQTTSEDEAT